MFDLNGLGGETAKARLRMKELAFSLLQIIFLSVQDLVTSSLND